LAAAPGGPYHDPIPVSSRIAGDVQTSPASFCALRKAHGLQPVGFRRLSGFASRLPAFPNFSLRHSGHIRR